MKSSLFFLLFVALLPLSQSAQEVGKVQFFLYGMHSDKNQTTKNAQLWNYTDSIADSKQFIEELITKTEQHFAWNHIKYSDALTQLNNLLLNNVYDAIEDSVELSGIKREYWSFLTETEFRYKKFISVLITGHESVIQFTGVGIPLSIKLNEAEKKQVNQILKIEDIYFISPKLELVKAEPLSEYYGIYPHNKTQFIQFSTDSIPFPSLAISVPAGLEVNQVTPDTTNKIINSDLYRILSDSLRQRNLIFSGNDTSSITTLNSGNSQLAQVCFVYNEVVDCWFSLGYYLHTPAWFTEGRPISIIQINGVKIWIIEIFNLKEIKFGYEFFIEDRGNFVFFGKAMQPF